MKTLIIEDELAPQKRLKKVLGEVAPEADIIACIQTVEEAVQWLSHEPSPDLIFMDIQLADGLSFEIFEHIQLECPIIFTTAYDEYAIKAFEVNSIAYLLKPIHADDVQKALEKYEKFRPSRQESPVIDQLLTQLQQQSNTYRARFLVKSGQSFLSVGIEEVAYFYVANQLVFLMTDKGKRYMLNHRLDDLEKQVDPSQFFKINRQYLISHTAIRQIHPYFNSRLTLDIHPKGEDAIVSRERVSSFKKWLDGMG